MAWARTRLRLHRQAYRWGLSTGPMAATILTLHHGGWSRVGPATWKEPGEHGDAWLVVDDSGMQPLLSRFAKGLEAQPRGKVVLLFCWEGLEQGSDTTSCRRPS